MATHHAPIGEPSAWVVRFAPLLRPGSHILDLACGAGRHTRLFLESGHSVTAVDRKLSRVADLRDGNARLTLMEADLENGSPWPLGNKTFDAVVVTNYLWRDLFPDILRSIAPGGYLIYETFAAGNERFGKPTNPDFLLREGELLEVVEGKLEVVEYDNSEVQTPKPAVLQRICARRNP